MARCPTCGKIWSCKNEDIMKVIHPGEEDEDLVYSFEERYPHCRTCRCVDCRKQAKENEKHLFIENFINNL